MTTTMPGQVAYVYVVDDDGLPVVNLADLPGLGGRVEFPELVGVDLVVAVEWAEEVGWEIIAQNDLDDDVLYNMSALSPAERIILDYRDGRVVSATAG